MSGASPLAAVRRPEYTGDRRCWACTVVNVGILAGTVGVLTVAVHPLAALAVGAVGLAAIWLRGYLVPGTPAFAPRLVAAVPGAEAVFEKPSTPPESAGSLGDGAPEADGEQLLETLVGAGVLELDGDAVVPAESFDRDWHDEMAALASRSTEGLADAVADVTPAAEVSVRRDERTGDEWVALGDGDAIATETWLNRPVAIAETAAVRQLPDTLDDATRRAAAARLRMFLAACPDCGTELEEGTTVPCCGGYNGQSDVPEETLVCPACESQVVTFATE
ncbi:MAG: hypothetical protein ABEJ40_12145 [Haloarculaceae archaeon]